ncbi:MAG: diadenosine tetraphosphatase [Proteobacteria bacterium]|nr:diadenosine tetraphosphatase [Pseudomonadota bacterium]
MATYAIGDLQGCFAELQCLLERIDFDPGRDRLWFTGDLVNRGPQSLETLRYIKGLGPAAVSVLGNHDLHLLAVASGISRTKHKDTFGAILSADDRDELLHWLRHRPLLHCEGGFYLIHAGLPPQWDMETAAERAHEVEDVLRGPNWRELLARMYGNEPAVWSAELAGFDRLRFITNCFTRMRYCDERGALEFHEKCRPGSQKEGLFPWFQAPGRRSAGARIIFGHWSTLGFHAENGCVGLDTGCLWGGELTALRLDGEKTERIAVSCLGHARPGAAKAV